MASEAQLFTKECAPVQLAEDLPYEVAYSGLGRYGTRRNPEGLFLSTWNHVEFALNRSPHMDDELRRIYIDYAQTLLGEVATSAAAHDDTQLGALVLSSYLICLQKRALDEKVLPQDCYDIYQGLGAAIKYLQPLDIQQPPQPRMIETAVLAASARMRRPELLMYPSSPREEASPIAQHNHDGYFLVDRTKLAIQQKLIPTDKNYDSSITLFVLEPILRRARKKAGLDESLAVSEQLNHVLALIVAETHGCQLTISEQLLLNHLSSAIAHHRFAAERTVTALAS